ncbi:hypothetical protein EGT07_00905 [Herbaspirillum sp. HC18]|nr:hypothetical protein EGT07_00905 [Herbaspirillum sp. HC18]
MADGIHSRAVLWSVAAIIAAAVLAVLVSYLLLRWWNVPSAAVPAPANSTLQSAPQQERAQYFAEKRRLIESWEWIDRKKGIARIPVEQAMRIMAARNGDKAEGQ